MTAPTQSAVTPDAARTSGAASPAPGNAADAGISYPGFFGELERIGE